MSAADERRRQVAAELTARVRAGEGAGAALPKEIVEMITIHYPDGSTKAIIMADGDELLQVDLDGCAVAWKEKDGKIHRSVGLPLEMVSTVSSIVL